MLNIKKIDILWKTICDNKLNLDSITHWNNDILVTSKDTHSVLCYDKDTGKFKYNIGKKGYDYDKFNRPNGITIIGDYLFVIERDNKRCQIFDMKQKKSIAFFGFKILKKPYGITGLIHKDQYILFITDDELDTIFKFNLKIYNNEIKKIKSSIFMELSGTSLESILIDNNNQRLLVANEKNKKIKIFDYNGILIHEITDIFEGDPEGITMTDNNYIFTDQTDNDTYFHIYDKKSIKYQYSYNNSLVTNTDGIHYDGEYLYAIDDDCSLVKLQIPKSSGGSSSCLFPIIITGLLVSIIKKLNYF